MRNEIADYSVFKARDVVNEGIVGKVSTYSESFFESDLCFVRCRWWKAGR